MNQRNKQIKNNDLQVDNVLHSENEQKDYEINEVNRKSLNDLPVQQSQSQDNDALQIVDQMLEQNEGDQQNSLEENNQYARQDARQRQQRLIFRIKELEKICYTLSQSNRTLTDKLQQTQILAEKNKKKLDNTVLNSSTEQNGYNDELTEMQCEFGQIQSLIQQYKEQLTQSQIKWSSIMKDKDEQIEILKQQIMNISENQDNFIQNLKEKDDQIEMLKSKNEQLLIELQNLQIQLENISENQSQLSKYQNHTQVRTPTYSPRYFDNRYENYDDHRFNEKIQKQMEIMIKKLMKELSNQKKTNKRLNHEIKRLNLQLIDAEKRMKQKNDQIYQFQMKIIQLEKQNPAIFMKSLTKCLPHQKLNYTPHQNKNTSRIIDYDQNIQLQQNRPISQNRSNPNPNTFEKKDYHPQYEKNSRVTQKSGQTNIKSSPSKLNKAQVSMKKQTITSKISSVQGSNVKKNQRYYQLQPNNLPNNSHESKLFSSFNLIQLQEGSTIKINIKQKIHIVCKLINFYCKKLQAKNYQTLMAENIQICNFHEKHINLIRIRVINLSPSKKTQEKQNQESILWNMAFIIDNVMRQVQTIDKKDLGFALNLIETIEDILPKSTQQKIDCFQVLSKQPQMTVS